MPSLFRRWWICLAASHFGVHAHMFLLKISPAHGQLATLLWARKQTIDQMVRIGRLTPNTSVVARRCSKNCVSVSNETGTCCTVTIKSPDCTIPFCAAAPPGRTHLTSTLASIGSCPSTAASWCCSCTSIPSGSIAPATMLRVTCTSNKPPPEGEHAETTPAPATGTSCAAATVCPLMGSAPAVSALLLPIAPNTSS